MAKKNVYGVCKLCLERRKLCKSDYLGKVLYKLSRENGEDPVIMTPDLVTLSPRQMWAHLLCTECEDRFRRLGEEPAMKLLYGKAGFPLLERMRLSLPLRRERSVIKFSGLGMGIDTDALAYFALSLLWRGGIHVWNTLKGQTSTLSLGKFEEPIRRYLLGEINLPTGIYVILTVCADRGSQVTTFPPSLVAASKYTMYSILVRGLWFHVIADENAARGVEDL